MPWPDLGPGAMLDGTNARLQSTRRNARTQALDRRRIAPQANAWTLFRGVHQSPCAKSRAAAGFPAEPDPRWSVLRAAIAVLAMRCLQAGSTRSVQSVGRHVASPFHPRARCLRAITVKFLKSPRTGHSIRNPAVWFERLDLSLRAGSNTDRK